MADLVVTSHTPALGSGRALRVYGVVAALARSGPVEVAYAPFGDPEPATAYTTLANVTLRRLEPTRGLGRAVAYARARAHGVPDGLARAVSPALVHSADAAGPDTRVIADGPAVAAALMPLAARRPVVHLAHNLESGFRHTPALERFERRVLHAFAAALDTALAGDSPDARRARNALADGHSWEARLAEIEAAVARAEA